MQVTRQRIIDILRAQGQSTVEELAKEVKLTPMAIRHHLNVLQADGLITILRTKQRHRPGRPIQVYGLTNKARKLYPQQYLQLTDLLVDEINDQIGPEAVRQIFGGIAERLASEAPSPAPTASPTARLDALVKYLQDKGFVAEWQVENKRYILCHYDCPYRQFAQSHPDVCLLDEKLISTFVGSEPAKQLSIARDDEMCKYVFTDIPVPAETTDAA